MSIKINDLNTLDYISDNLQEMSDAETAQISGGGEGGEITVSSFQEGGAEITYSGETEATVGINGDYDDNGSQLRKFHDSTGLQEQSKTGFTDGVVTSFVTSGVLPRRSYRPGSRG